MSSQFDDKLAAVLDRHYPGFTSLVSAERLSGGASQETYRVEIETSRGSETLALRRAAGGISTESTTTESTTGDSQQGEQGTGRRPGLEVEALLMQAAREVGVPEPEVHYVLEASDGLGDGFLMEWLEGETLGARIVRLEELAELRTKLAYECGVILAKLHAIDLDKTGLRSQLEEMSPERYLHQTWDRYKALDVAQPMIDYAGCWLDRAMPKAERLTLVHNDFRNGNVMVSAQGVVAVLDWEIAHVGDPMRDLGWMCTNSWRYGKTELPVGGFGQREDLFAGYEAESGITVDPEQVKWWEVFGSFWWAISCLGMVEHYRTGPDASVERPAIGRRSSESQVDCVNLLIPGPVALVEPEPTEDLDMPRKDELVGSVRDFLRNDVMAATTGRPQFLARVAANSLDVVFRDLALGKAHRAREHQRLRQLLGGSGDLASLRWQLVNGLRDGSIPLATEGLAEHLRATVVNQIAIDQPRYSGFKTAIRAND